MKNLLLATLSFSFCMLSAHAAVVTYVGGVTNTNTLAPNNWVYLPNPPYPAMTVSKMYQNIIRDYSGSPNGQSGATGATEVGFSIFGGAGYDITKLSWVIGIDGGADTDPAMSLYTGAGSETVSPGPASEGKEDYRYDTLGGTADKNLIFYYDNGVVLEEWVSGYITRFVTTVTDIDADTATGFGEVVITESTAAGMDFFNEIMTLSNGTGLIEYTATNFLSTDLSVPGSFSSDGSFTVVPEPSSWASLVGVCALSVAFLRRRK